MAVPSEPAARHREFSGSFAEVIARVTDWDAPSPVKEWVARDIPAHLVSWLPGVLESFAGVSMPQSELDPAADPANAWQEHSTAVQAILDDPELANRKVSSGPFAGSTVAELIDRIYTTDVFMHRWDLARSNGLDPVWDVEFAEELLHGLASMEQMLRESGQFGARVPVPESAPVTDRLAGFLGRDPAFGL